MAYKQELIATARAMCAPGKGLLAADESTGTIGKRFADINVKNTEPNRQAYRQLLFTTPGYEKYISGVIMYEETLFQKTDDGVPFVELLKKDGVIPGIKVDKGARVLSSGVNGDFFTQGLTDLDLRCQKYYKQGARFAKWRAVYSITKEGAPSELCIQENARGLAQYAAICQANGLVPIVEPELLMDGDHSIEVCFAVTQRIHAAVFKALHDFNILFEGMILKPNMVCPGKSCPKRNSAYEIADATVKLLRRTTPSAVPGVLFLSGGLSEDDATEYLQVMNAVVQPWSLSFSYGRALQKSCLATWKGQASNVAKAQEVFLKRAKECFEAGSPRNAKM